MCSWKLLVFIFLNLTNLFSSVKSQNYRCGNNGNYTSDSTYRANLNTLLSSVSSNIDSNNNGFYNTSTGENPDRVNSIMLCRGDVQLEACHSCIRNATRSILQLCPYQKQAIFWAVGDVCMLRYSNESIFGKLETSRYFDFAGYRIDNATSRSEFNQDLRTLLDRLQNQAAYGSLKKYAAANTTGPDLLTIYGLVQCTPDLTSRDCSDCLTMITQSLSQCCSGRQGFGMLTPSCILRYETYTFFNDTPQPAPPPQQVSLPAPPGNDDNTTQIIIVTIVPIVAILMLALCIGIVIRMRRKSKPEEKSEIDEGISTVESLQYEFGTIRDATDNFSVTNKLGEGGFGIVYKGKLPNGNEIAVKRLSQNSGQGDLEFKNEVLLVARLQHRNLVRLLGFSVEGNERLLIYEWVQNGSLDRFIFNSNKPCLNWEKRYIIIAGVAKGLLYLHEDSRLRIIHRDLKAGNILLDGEMNPKITDFGMARLFVPDETQHSTSRVVGTYGYMAPEYVIHGQFSVKSDVFSFGILILEIVTGQATYNFRNEETMDDLTTCVWKNWHKGTIANIIDPALRTSSGSMRDIMRCIHIGLLCVQENAANRPTIGSVVLMLSSFSLTMPVPSEPAFFMFGSFRPEISVPHETHSSKDQSDNNIHLSTNEASMSELYPR